MYQTNQYHFISTNMEFEGLNLKFAKGLIDLLINISFVINLIY